MPPRSAAAAARTSRATGPTAAAPKSSGAAGDPGWIRIRGARQNNLLGVDVDVPRGKLVTITGLSGSGKSSLAFDTLFREGQRRFLETLSAYARQFLGRMEKPDVDHVEGLSPAIAVDQKAVPRGPRSTVGTITEIVDHLRVLYARAGTARCPDHGEALATQTSEAIVRQIAAAFRGQAVHVLAPYIRDRKGHHRPALDDLARKGFVRARVDGAVVRIEEAPELERYKRHTIEAVVDRLRLKADPHDDDGLEPTALARLREAVHGALELGSGDVVVFGDKNETDRGWSTLRACSKCGYEAPPLEPRTFSFNSPHGACPDCDGLGLLRAPSEYKVVADPNKSIREGALAVTRQSGGKLNFPNVGFAFLEKVARHGRFNLDTPWKELSDSARQIVLYGTGEKRFEDSGSWDGERSAGQVTWRRRYRGVLPAVARAWRRGGRRKLVERFLDVEVCPECEGSRLSEFARNVHVGGVGVAELLMSPVRDVSAKLDAMDLTKREAEIARALLVEIRRRIGFLEQVGLGYLTLDRSADTLSGGEAQRIRLAAQLGAGLQGVLYVLDEPSIGLHARDHGRLLGALSSLRDAGNSVVVVEHDEATLRAADWVVDIGPGAGAHGGRVVAQGPPSEVAKADSPTGELLRGELPMPAPSERRATDGRRLQVLGARGFNLKGIDVDFPLDAFVCVTGVSGSGKSTLVDGTLAPAIAQHLGRDVPSPREHDEVSGLEHVEDLVHVTASPIGRTPRSNPATYSGAFTPIRDLFASLPESRMHGWQPGRFSFNVAGGRCERCQGAGAEYVELQFLAPVTVPCPDCGGRRFRDETLEVKYRGRSIADVLEMTIEEAAELFVDIPKVKKPLGALVEVGLGYLRLGQPSTTISGGEAQRVKLAKHLQKRSRKHTLYLLDEPTTGLHQKDVARLVGALQSLVDQGNTVLVIEHNLDVVRAADYVIDLGPEGGAEGGQLLAMGTPEEIEAADSHTGRALSDDARRKIAVPEEVPADLGLAPVEEIRVRGARTHNLKAVDVDIPRDKLTVVTGVSGSGKSSLALDTIHAAGRQRFVESLSTYARQFLSSRDRPPVDLLEGLGPSVAVEASTSHGHPRSTVATTTEIHDHLRVLWARAGVRRCPTHGERLARGDASTVSRAVVKSLAGKRGWIVAPMFGPGTAGEFADEEELAAAIAEAVDAWRKAGYARALVAGEEVRLDGKTIEATIETPIDLVIDRLAFDAKSKSRIAEAVETAESHAGGRVSVLVKGRSKTGRATRMEFSTHGACTKCGFRQEGELEPRQFSFNTHVGACPACDGLGQRWHADPELLVDKPELPLIDPNGGKTAVSGKLGRYLTKGKGFYEHLLRTVAASHRIDVTRPFEALTEKQQALLLHGEGARAQYKVEVEKLGTSFEITTNYTAEWPGLCGHVDAWHAKSEDPEWRTILESFMGRRECRTCEGERLAPGPRAVTVGRKRLPEILAATVEDAQTWLDNLKLAKAAAQAVGQVVDELKGRVELLERVGLGYLTLDRSVATLSSGEARRVRLSASLGSHLVGVCYVLDEPTVGLHPADVDKLGDALFALRDGGNTVLVVEHDEALMRRADWLVDMGPGAGRYGGQVVFSGPPEEARDCAESKTGQALAGELALPVRADSDRRVEGEKFGLRGASLHNLRDVSFTAQYGELLGVCGPSGSGKSTLILDCLVPALAGERPAGRWRSAVGMAGGGRRTVVVDASPIGRTPASVPATAVGLMKPLRELFARTPESRMRGYTGSNFSFNSNAGRCQECEGLGATKVEMQFLADLWLTCEECDGKRFRPEILAVTYRGRSIADFLAMPAEAALELLGEVPALAKPLATLVEVGLGYMALGQSSTTLSGGEAQRVKLAAELCRTGGEVRSVIVLDEPSTGLHQADVVHLHRVLARLAERGDAVIVIEHHVELLAACDRLVELGPGGGAAGGRVIAGGTPAELARDKNSVTGPWLPKPRTAKNKGGGASKRAAKKSPRGRSKEGVTT